MESMSMMAVLESTGYWNMVKHDLSTRVGGNKYLNFPYHHHHHLRKPPLIQQLASSKKYFLVLKQNWNEGNVHEWDLSSLVMRAFIFNVLMHINY